MYGNSTRSIGSDKVSFIANSKTNLHAPPEYVGMPKQNILGSKKNLIDQVLLMDSKSSFSSADSNQPELAEAQ